MHFELLLECRFIEIKKIFFGSFSLIIVNFFVKFFESLFLELFSMTYSTQVLKLNLLPPEKLYCDFNYWSSLFTQDMHRIWEKGHGIPLNKLPLEVSDMIFPYLLLALSDYKLLNKKKISWDRN